MTFPSYQVYKSSGQDWIGEMPGHWHIYRSKNVFSERNIKAVESDEQLTASQKYGVIPQKLFCQLEDQKVMQVILGRDILKKAEVNDFVISMRSFQGGLEFCSYSGAVSSAYVPLHANRELDNRFFKHLFKSVSFISALQNTSNLVRDGQALRYNNFVQLSLPFPSINEQRTIGAFLDHETARIDVLIEEQQRLIELLKEKRQAVISHAVTKGLAPTVPMKDSGVEWLGEVPAHWELTRVGWQCIVGNGCTPARDNQSYWDDGHYPWLNSSKVNLERVVEADQFVTSQALKECALPIVKPGSVLMAITGEGKTRGMVTITEIEATINQHVAFIEPRGSELLPTFLHDWLSANYSRLRHDSADWGSTKAAITCGDIRAYPLPLPPLAEQEAICQFVGSKSSLIDGLISSADENVNLLYERRSALISAAVTGKIDVRSWQPPASEPLPELAQEAV